MAELITIQTQEEKKKAIAGMLKQLENKLVPYIYSRRQFEVILKRLEAKELTKTEERYWYGQIRKKHIALAILKELDALRLLYTELPEIILETKKEHFVNGRELMIKERVEEAKTIIEDFEKQGYNKVMVYGSFLIKERYDDIDIFIVTKNKDEDEEIGNKHIYYIPEKELKKSLLFQTIKQVAIANFNLDVEYKGKINTAIIIDLYNEIINLISNKFDYKQELRNLIAGISFLIEKEFIGPAELEKKLKDISQNPVNNLHLYLLPFFKKFVSKREVNIIIKNNQYIIDNYPGSDAYKKANDFLKRIR